MQTPFVIMNGEVLPLAEAKVPINDRSFLFGDSLYEVIATHRSRPFFTQDHLDRLRLTAAGIHMELPEAWTDDWFREQIRWGLEQTDLDEVYVRIVISRGAGDFNIDVNSVTTAPLAVFIFKPLPVPGPEFEARGYYLAVPETRRNAPNTLSPAYKTGNYLNNILCLYEAKAQGADDALILDLQGHVTEATTSNLFMVKDGVIQTAPVEVGILHGITRKHLIRVAQELGLPLKEEPFGLDAIYAADEVFVSSTIKGAFPVYRINDQRYPEGYGPITRQLDNALWEYIEAHLDVY